MSNDLTEYGEIVAGLLLVSVAVGSSVQISL